MCLCIIFCDYLNHCLATGRSLTVCLHFVNKIPVDWYSKKQATQEIVTYGSEFVAANTATEQIMDITQNLRYLGAPISSMLNCGLISLLEISCNFLLIAVNINELTYLCGSKGWSIGLVTPIFDGESQT